jgi:hypothetical protein
MSHRDQPILVSPVICLQIALKCAILIAIIEAPILFFELVRPDAVLIGGWVALSGYALIRLRSLFSQALLVNEFGFIKLVGGVALSLMTGVVMFVTVMSSRFPTSDRVYQIKAAFISNAFVALGVAGVLVTGMSIIDRIRSNKSLDQD